MDKIEILEENIKTILKLNYNEKIIAKDLAEDELGTTYRKNAFEYVLDMIKEIKEGK